MDVVFRNRLDSPFYIFMSCADEYSDHQLMEILGLNGYSSASKEGKGVRKLYISNYGDWTCVADDFYYTLWYDKNIRQKVASIALEHDVYMCSVADANFSFDFCYYEKGNLRRKFVFEQVFLKPGVVSENFGSILQGEEEAMAERDELDKVLKLAGSLGIEVDFNKHSIRTYFKCIPFDDAQMVSGGV